MGGAGCSESLRLAVRARAWYGEGLKIGRGGLGQFQDNEVQNSLPVWRFANR
jgi:hypothetical protein